MYNYTLRTYIYIYIRIRSLGTICTCTYACIHICKIYLDPEMWIGWLAIYDEQSKTTSKVKVNFKIFGMDTFLD